jgi:hypothetical protein
VRLATVLAAAKEDLQAFRMKEAEYLHPKNVQLKKPAVTRRTFTKCPVTELLGYQTSIVQNVEFTEHPVYNTSRYVRFGYVGSCQIDLG